jgi:2-keto-3-deoxy-6-phosphogluconate aldolase
MASIRTAPAPAKKKSGRLFDAYRAVHQQGFLPIFTQTDHDSRVLVEACVAAGCRAIEYTLRRRDADRMIPWIRKNYPDLTLLVGSTLDDDAILKKVKPKNPQLRTIAELADMGVHGFVSMIGWREENIRKYAPTHLVLPCAMTLTEAFRQVGAGAQFIKINGPELGVVRTCRAAATFEFCPIFVTGGMVGGNITAAIEAGAVLVGAGFDLMLKGGGPLTVASAADALKREMETVRIAREKVFPALAKAGEQSWSDSLPHVHPF